MQRIPILLFVFALTAILLLPGCQRNDNAGGDVTVGQTPETCLERLNDLEAKLEYHANGNLKAINLVGIEIDDAALNGLGQFKTLESITIASHNEPNDKVTDVTIAQLSGMATLKSLDVCGTAVTVGQTPETCLERLNDLGVKLEYHANGNLKAINLVGIEIDDAALNGLGQFKTLESITIASHNEPNDKVTDVTIAQLSGMATLKSLDVCGTAVTSGVLPQLQNMKALSQLKMSGKLSGDGLKVLGTQFPALSSLAFDHSDIGNDDLIEIAKVKKLVGLFLAYTNITDEGLSHLISLSNLRNIRLSNTTIASEGIKSLTSLKALINIDLSNTNVGDAALVALSEMTQLERLNLYMTKVTDAGVDSLLPLVNLNWLNLDACRINDESVPKLATLKKLTFLHLGSTDISDDCIDTLKTMPHVKELHVTRTKITRQGAESLVAALPQDRTVIVDKVVDEQVDDAIQYQFWQ